MALTMVHVFQDGRLMLYARRRRSVTIFQAVGGGFASFGRHGH